MERSDPVNYLPGQYVEFMLNAKGFQKSDKWMVSEVTENDEVIVQNRSGGKQRLPLQEADRFQVFEASELRLAAGDKIHFRQNGKAKEGNRLHNGSVHELAGFDDNGDIVLANGWTVAADFGHLDYGYVLTSHASQGKTVDHVLIAQGSQSWNASNREQFYVSASRGRRSIRIYTDNREDLLESVLGSSQRMSAMELEAELREKRAETQSAALNERERIVSSHESKTAPSGRAPLPAADRGPAAPPPPNQAMPSGRLPESNSSEATASAKPPRQQAEERHSPKEDPQKNREKSVGPTFAPRAASVDEIVRAQELLAKYGGLAVESGPEDFISKERASELLDRYAYRGYEENDSRSDKSKRRDRDRSE